jgi:hypothetical protein
MQRIYFVEITALRCLSLVPRGSLNEKCETTFDRGDPNESKVKNQILPFSNKKSNQILCLKYIH